MKRSEMHQYWWALKSSSYFHSFCAALALSAHPIPLLPGTSGCLGFAANEVIKRTTSSPSLWITSGYKSHLVMSITWRKVLGTDPLASGWHQTFQNLWAWPYFLGKVALWQRSEVLEHIVPLWSRLWHTVDMMHVTYNGCKSCSRDTPYRCSPEGFLASQLLWKIVYFENCPLGHGRGK